MDKKTITRSIRNFLGFSILRISLLLTSISPRGAIYKITPLIARIGYFFSGRNRRIAQEGLDIAFGGSFNHSQTKQVIIGSFQEMATGALETAFLLNKPHAFDDKIKLIGSEHLRKALSAGKGAVAVSAHFGNFVLLVANLSRNGFPIGVVVRPMRDEKMNRYFSQKRQEFRIETVYSKPAKECVDKSLAFLKKNGVLFNMLDQNFGAGSGVFVDFFGTQAATATGPVVLALRSKAPILPVFIIRKPDHSQEIIVEPELAIEKQDNFDRTVIHNISRLTKIIEGYIRKYPTQWSWIHRRWKSRPSNKAITYGAGTAT